jgi:hypothetical protein
MLKVNRCIIIGSDKFARLHQYPAKKSTGKLTVRILITLIQNNSKTAEV